MTIETLDNPGWHIKIDLKETGAAGRSLDRVTIRRSNQDWMDYHVKDDEFRAACGPLNLSETLQTFVDWFKA